MGPVVIVTEDPTASGRLLAQHRTSVGCFDPMTGSSLGASEVVRHTVLEGLLAWARSVHKVVVEGSPEERVPDLAEDTLDFAAGNLDPGMGTAAAGADRPVHSMNPRVRGHQGLHRLVRRGGSENLSELVLHFVLGIMMRIPAGFFSSSSINSFIFFLRKSMITK